VVDVKQGFINLTKYIALIIIVYISFSLLFVSITIYDDLYISPALKERFWKPEPKKSGQYIISIVSPTRFGEKNQSVMVREAAEKMGHLVYSYVLNDKDMDLFLPAKYMNELLLYILAKRFNTDINLAMSFHVNIDLPDPKIMYISVPPAYFIDKVKEQYPMVSDYTYILDINNKGDWLNQVLNKKFNRTHALVGVPANKYKDSDRKRLLLFGSLWGRKTSQLYTAIKDLAKQDYMFFIRHNFLLLGLNDTQNFSEEAEGLSGLQERLNQYGIGLCIHSKYHVEAGVPSSRIFEIISSGAIAISDMNPFVIDNFGDNVLYFDPSLSAEEIYKKINAHVKWVQDNPVEAAIKAKNAHQILEKNFTTERFVKEMIEALDKR